MKIGTYLPLFSGFYCTMWDNSEDGSIEYNLKEEGIFDEELEEVYWSKLYTEAYRQYEIDVIQHIISCVEYDLKKLGMIKAIKFEKVVSPKAYNFSNDSADVSITITKANASKIVAYINKNKDKWAIYLKKHFTSYDGFCSFYDNTPDSDDWNDIEEGLKHDTKCGVILEFILKNEGITEWDYKESSECYMSVNLEDLRAELEEKGFYEDKPDLLQKHEERIFWQGVKDTNLSFNWKVN